MDNKQAEQGLSNMTKKTELEVVQFNEDNIRRRKWSESSRIDKSYFKDKLIETFPDLLRQNKK